MAKWIKKPKEKVNWFNAHVEQVRWEDHSAPGSDEVEAKRDAFIIDTVGHVVEENPKALILAMYLDEEGHAYPEHQITILKKLIIARRRL